LGPYKVEGQQCVAIYRLYEDLLEVTSLSPAKALGEGRGTTNLVNILDILSNEGLLNSKVDGDPGLNCLAKECIARDINVENASLPPSAGLCDPLDILPEPYRSELLDTNSRIKNPAPKFCDLPVPCYKVKRKDEKALREALLRSGMAGLMEESEVACTEDGSLILSGVFGVLTKGGKLRFIFDRRAPNMGERRLHWITLPHGTQFCYHVQKPGHKLRGSGTDLSKFFYRLKELESMFSRNCFGRCFDGKGYANYGGKRGHKYRMCLKVVAMGSLNAVDIATQTHLSLAHACGGLPKSATLAYGKPLPEGPLRGGIYVDDLLLTLEVPDEELLSPHGLDQDCISNILPAYRDNNLPVAGDKGFGFGDLSLPVQERRGAPKFLAWGTSVNSLSGHCGAPPDKRVLLSLITFFVVGQRIIFLEVLEKLLGLLIHPLMHFKAHFSALHRIFKWKLTLVRGRPYRWPADIRDELIYVALLLPTCYTNMKAQISTRVSATDATQHSGGAVFTSVSNDFAKSLFKSVEVKGCHTFLPSCKLSPEQHDQHFPRLQEDPIISAFGRSGDWKVSRSCHYPSQHVNVQEIKEICQEAKRLCNSCLCPLRQINLTDSAVGLGAYGKFRSSAFKLNEQLRAACGWLTLSRKLLYNIHVRTHANPGDPPSRFVKFLRDSVPDWLLPYLEQEYTLKGKSEFGTSKWKLWLETFAGSAGLSAAWQLCELLVGHPIECWKDNNYNSDGDMEQVSVIDKIENDIYAGYIFGLHFGIVCRSWGPASRFQPERSRSTRTKENPLGTGERPAEIQGNLHADHVCRLLVALLANGCYFTLENPAGSYVFRHPRILAALEGHFHMFVTLDQCQYGLKLPGCKSNEFCRKRTTILTNIPELRDLAKLCPGTSASHKHVHAWGSAKVGNKLMRMSTAAAHYPPPALRGVG